MAARRSSRRRRGFTLIELLVVVAIIALLVSILLPSLNKAREQAKAAVCASRLRSFGQASALYEHEFNSFVPCDPWHLMPEAPPGYQGQPRNSNEPSERVDPSIGWLTLYGLRISPDIRDPMGSDVYDPWQRYPYGFKLQSLFNPEDLWEGFFCPSQNRRNTMSDDSPELDPLDSHEGYPVIYKYASGYMANRLLRSATTTGRGEGVRWSVKPSETFEQRLASTPGLDNIFGSAVARVDAGAGLRSYHVQGVNGDELLAAADTIYMCDTLDYHTSGSTPVAPFGGGTQSAGMWYLQLGGSPPLAFILGARHLGKANVLYADSHVSNDGLAPRNKRGTLVIASTFADYVQNPQIGNQFHAMPTWRKFEVD